MRMVKVGWGASWCGAGLLGLVLGGCGGPTETIQFGVIAPQTGEGAAYGKEMILGAQLAAETINSEGGAGGRKQIELRIEDSRSDPARAAQLMEQMGQDEKIIAVIGGVTSGEAVAMAPKAEATKTVLISPTASTPTLSEFGEYVWRNYPSDGQFISTLAFYCRFSLRVKKVAVVAARNEYADGVREVFERKFTAAGETEMKEFLYNEGELNAGAIIGEVKAYRPDAVLLVAYVDDQVTLLRVIQEQELKAQILASETFTVEGAHEAGPAAEGVITPQPPFDVADTNPRVKSFVTRFQEKFRHLPTVDSAQGYDAVRILASALAPIGKIKHTLKDNMKGVQDFQGVAGETSFDVNGDVVKDPWLYRVENGELIRIPS
ncbi:MAG TPA: ABC transporter substrate-binding protein [Acidobacteriota bacterium]